MAFELPAKQHSQFSPSGSTFLHCLSLPSKSHRENSISSIFLESTHQVGMKNVVKCQKHFFGYFNVLKTHGVLGQNFTDTIWIGYNYSIFDIFQICKLLFELVLKCWFLLYWEKEEGWRQHLLFAQCIVKQWLGLLHHSFFKGPEYV